MRPGSSLKAGNGKFLGMEAGLRRREGESGGGGARILFMKRDKKAAFDVGVGGAIGSKGMCLGKYGGKPYGLNEFAKNAELK